MTFSKKHVWKKEYLPGSDNELSDEEEEDEEDEDEEIKSPGRTTLMVSNRKKTIKSKTKAKKENLKAKSLSSWYFVCENKY